MAVDVNYWWIGVLLFAIVGLITWIIKRNLKDEKRYEKEMVSMGRKSTKHKQEKYNITTP